MLSSILTSLVVLTLYHNSQGVVTENNTVKLFKAFEDALLTCPVTSDPGGNETVWYRNNSDGKTVELRAGDGKKYLIDPINSTLTVFKVGEHDIGPYECQVAKRNYTVYIAIVPVVRLLEKSRNLVEGDQLSVDCFYWAWPAPNVTWYKADPTADNVLLNATYLANSSRLMIDHVTRADYMKYICTVSNEIGSNNATVLVRVKYKLAPLWPFLGIVAEILILVIIIIVYEKRRSKQMADEARKDEAEQLTNSTEHRTSKDDVRQRK